MIMGILGLINLFFAIVIGLYFWNLLRQQQGGLEEVLTWVLRSFLNLVLDLMSNVEPNS